MRKATGILMACIALTFGAGTMAACKPEEPQVTEGAIYVTEGQYVSRGDVIAAVGNSGNSTAAHLHFSVCLNGVAQDPGNYLGKTLKNRAEL